MSQTTTVTIPDPNTPLTKEANNTQESRGICSKLGKLKNRLLPGIRVSLIIMTLIYLAMFILGCTNVKKCPANPNIPLYLTAAGAIGVLTRTLTVIKSVVKLYERVLKEIESFLYGLEGVFFVLGSYWVYSEYKPSFDPQIEPYCNKTAYLVSFWFITAHYVVILMLLFGLCSLCLILLCFNDESDDEVTTPHVVESSQNESPNKTTQ